MNHTIAIPSDSFLSEAKHEYSDIRSRLLVEFLQNSIDARAKTINFTYEENESGRFLTVEDDGTGMKKETMISAMLTYAGSKKDAGSVGGFGAAKKLLLLSHDEYWIETLNLAVHGQVINYSLTEKEDMDSWVIGTKIKIKFSEAWGETNLENHLHFIMKRSSIAAKVYWNGRLVEQAESKAAELETEFATIRKGNGENLVVVRFGGLCMFVQHSNHSYFYDCKGHSRDALRQNREGFRSGDHQQAFYRFINTISQNSMSGISAAAHAQKTTEIVQINGIAYRGFERGKKMTNREQQIWAFCRAVLEKFDFCYKFGSFRMTRFGFYRSPNAKGVCDGSWIWINPDSFQGENWQIPLMETFIHEYVHLIGHMSHDEAFISKFGQIFAHVMENYSGINPLMADMRRIKKEMFN